MSDLEQDKDLEMHNDEGINDLVSPSQQVIYKHKNKNNRDLDKSRSTHNT